MRRLAHALLLGLFGAGIVHIAIILLLPSLADRDAWSRLSSVADLFVVTRLGAAAPDAPNLISPNDPLFVAAACRFDLAEGFLRARAPGGVPFWSASVYDRDGRNVYSLNDRLATAAGLDISVVTAPQLAELRKSPVEGLTSSVIVELQGVEGILVVRALVPDQTWATSVSRFLDGLKCAEEAPPDA